MAGMMVMYEIAAAAFSERPPAVGAAIGGAAGAASGTSAAAGVAAALMWTSGQLQAGTPQPSERELTRAVAQYLSDHGDLCVGKFTWPRLVTHQDRYDAFATGRHEDRA